jgi:hypothetical protein
MFVVAGAVVCVCVCVMFCCALLRLELEPATGYHVQGKGKGVHCHCKLCFCKSTKNLGMASPSVNVRVSIVAWGDRYNPKSGATMPQVIVVVCLFETISSKNTNVQMSTNIHSHAVEDLRRQHSVVAKTFSSQNASSSAAVE